MKFEPQRLFRYYHLRFLRLKGDPRQIAKGVALGVFIGVTPTIPLHTISVVFAAPLLRANLIAALLASVAVCNPLTYLPQYYLSWYIGNHLTPFNLNWDRIEAVMKIAFSDAGFQEIMKSLAHVGRETAIVLLTGGFILALPLALLSYLISFKFFQALRNKRRQKQILYEKNSSS